MNSSKFPQASDECSSSESGWTAYIAPSDHEDDHDDDQDRSRGKEEQGEDEKEANSDDSMASDASSGPSYHYPFNKHHGVGHATNINGRKEAGKKEQKLQEDRRQRGEKIKAAKDKADRATRSKKK